MPKVRWVVSYGFVENFIGFPAVQEFWKSIKILQSYRQLKGGNFFQTQCIACRFVWRQLFDEEPFVYGNILNNTYPKQTKTSNCTANINIQEVSDIDVVVQPMLELLANPGCGWPTTTTPQPFYGTFSGTTRVSRYQKRTSGLYGARED